MYRNIEIRIKKITIDNYNYKFSSNLFLINNIIIFIYRDFVLKHESNLHHNNNYIIHLNLIKSIYMEIRIFYIHIIISIYNLLDRFIDSYASANKQFITIMVYFVYI